MSRTGYQLANLTYLLTVPAGAYVYFMEPNSEYPSKMGGLVVVVLAIVGIVLVVFAERRKPEMPDLPSKSMDDKAK